MDNTSDPRRYGFSAQDLSYCTSKTMRLFCEARAFVPVQNWPTGAGYDKNTASIT